MRPALFAWRSRGAEPAASVRPLRRPAARRPLGHVSALVPIASLQREDEMPMEVVTIRVGHPCLQLTSGSHPSYRRGFPESEKMCAGNPLAGKTVGPIVQALL